MMQIIMLLQRISKFIFVSKMVLQVSDPTVPTSTIKPTHTDVEPVGYSDGV